MPTSVAVAFGLAIEAHPGRAPLPERRSSCSRILDWVASQNAPAVVESTGLSDAPLFTRLVERSQVITVRLDVTEDEALRRIGDREQGRHLSDDLELNRRVWQAFHERVLPQARVDLVVDTAVQSVDSSLAAIIAAVGRTNGRGGG